MKTFQLNKYMAYHNAQCTYIYSTTNHLPQTIAFYLRLHMQQTEEKTLNFKMQCSRSLSMSWGGGATG